METPLRTAMRWTSLASCRADKIVYDAANENVYVDEVVVKANRNRQRILVPEKQVGTVTISRWYLDPALLELYEEELQLDGFSLFEYMRSRDRVALPWIVARDDTFGPHMRGQLVSPLWRGGKHGYLSRSALGDVLERITHERLGLQSGRGHPLRRKAAIDYAALSVRYPQAVEAIIRMGPAMWNRYRVSVDRNPALLFAGQRSVSDILSGRADSDDVSTSGDVPAPASASGPAAPPPVARRRRIRARIAPEDLFGA
ncbi:MAG: hypothetical protein KGJ98_10565 [Chloroflexota bacterium]|nr:hypothetical protein [Chloroflexota bacterium]